MVKKILNGMLISLSLVLFVGCGKVEVKEESSNGQKVEDVEKEAKKEVKDVELIQDSIEIRNEFAQGKFFIDGVIKNNSDKKLKNLTLEITYTNDKDGVTKTSEYLIDVGGEPNSETSFTTEFVDFREIGSFTKFDASIKDYILE